MQGYNGSQCWDTAFACQAIAEAGLADAAPLALRRSYAYFERTQILSTPTSQVLRMVVRPAPHPPARPPAPGVRVVPPARARCPHAPQPAHSHPPWAIAKPAALELAPLAAPP